MINNQSEQGLFDTVFKNQVDRIIGNCEALSGAFYLNTGSYITQAVEQCQQSLYIIVYAQKCCIRPGNQSR